ncbi:hypothetical protein NC653_041316 [Populus alba x Populus x berolinensis]|uniref:Uncharacterized protein n=1 Tax=Populus alba x Populus x berolinensis TaxID=444605 RepID=A0AAD6PP19_9ROSI|nr:hypothetical protein NC653_041316 [Populus alba x Populus x berolinensis]
MPKNAVTKILSTKTKTHKKLKNPPALLPRCQLRDRREDWSDNAGHEPAAAGGNGVQCVDGKAANVKLRHR